MAITIGLLVGFVFGALYLWTLRLCPHCRQTIAKTAGVCSHCGRDVVPVWPT